LHSPRSVLLLNPPGTRSYIRDYYCSKTSRSDYVFPPVDLLHAGARFRAAGWSLRLLDCMAPRLAPEAALRRILAAPPAVIFSLVGAVSLDEDRQFLAGLRQALPRTMIIGSGDVLLEDARGWIASGLLDAAVLDFDSPSIVRYADGERGPLPDLICAAGGPRASAARSQSREVAIGLPPHDLFGSRHYRLPFAYSRPVASLLTDFGCPCSCTYCVMAGLPYHCRPLSEIERELQELARLRIREFVLWDQTFALDRGRARAFLDRLQAGSWSWTCFTRPDCLDADLARRLCAAGCHTVIMGVETASPTTLARVRKPLPGDLVTEAFRLCRASGIETVATVIVGLPGETLQDIEATMALVLRIDPDYLSVHTAIPRAGTELRRELLAGGQPLPPASPMDQSGMRATMASDSLSADEITRMRRSFHARFYLRPTYLLRRMARALRHPRRLLEQARQGAVLLWRNL